MDQTDPDNQFQDKWSSTALKSVDRFSTETKHQCTGKDSRILRYDDWQRYAYCPEFLLS